MRMCGGTWTLVLLLSVLAQCVTVGSSWLPLESRYCWGTLREFLRASPEALPIETSSYFVGRNVNFSCTGASIAGTQEFADLRLTWLTEPTPDVVCSDSLENFLLPCQVVDLLYEAVILGDELILSEFPCLEDERIAFLANHPDRDTSLPTGALILQASLLRKSATAILYTTAFSLDIFGQTAYIQRRIAHGASRGIDLAFLDCISPRKVLDMIEEKKMWEVSLTRDVSDFERMYTSGLVLNIFWVRYTAFLEGIRFITLFFTLSPRWFVHKSREYNFWRCLLT